MAAMETEGEDRCGFALGPTDLGLNLVWSVRQGRERKESRVCPGFGAQWDPSDPLTPPGLLAAGVVSSGGRRV